MTRKRRRRVPPQKTYQTRITAPPSRKLNYLIGALSLVVLVFVSSTVLKFVSGVTSSLPTEYSYLRVQDLNGCGVKDAAADMGKIISGTAIEATEFDVIDEDNFETFEVTETLILCRDERANPHALALAGKIGIHPDNVVGQELTDNYLNVDLTVIVGKDFADIQKQFTSSDED